MAFRAFGNGLGRGETARRLQWPKKSRRRLALRNGEQEDFYSVLRNTPTECAPSCITLSKDQQGLAASRLCGTT